MTTPTMGNPWANPNAPVTQNALSSYGPWSQGYGYQNPGNPTVDMGDGVTLGYAQDQQQPQGSALDQLVSQLTNNMNGMNVGQFMMPYGTLQQIAQNQANLTYDPQIANLQNYINTQRGVTDTNKARAGALYNSLAQSFANDLPAVQQQMQNAQQTVQNRYENSKQQLQDQYNDQSQNQQATLDKLGINAAAPGATANLNADQKYFQAQQQLQNQQAQNQLAEQGNSLQNYQKGLSDTSQMAGTNAQNQLENQYQQLALQGTGEENNLRAQKAEALANTLSQLQMGNFQNAHQYYQEALGNMMNLANFQLGAQKEAGMEQYHNMVGLGRLLTGLRMNQALGSQGKQGLAGISDYLAQAYPNDPNKAAQLSNIVTQTLGDPNASNANGGVTPNAEDLMQILDGYAKQNNLSNEDENNAIDALLQFHSAYK